MNKLQNFHFSIALYQKSEALHECLLPFTGDILLKIWLIHRGLCHQGEKKRKAVKNKPQIFCLTNSSPIRLNKCLALDSVKMYTVSPFVTATFTKCHLSLFCKSLAHPSSYLLTCYGICFQIKTKCQAYSRQNIYQKY